jgi:hypothetical protein
VKRWEAWWNHAALVAVGLTGLVYGAFRYFVANPDPDSRMGHPWQPGLMKAHLLVAPFAVFGIGLLLRRHALLKLRRGEERGRRSGVVMLALFAPLVVTGYLVQALTGPAGAKATGWIHSALGVLVVLGYVLHPKRHAEAQNGSENGDG